MTRSFFIRAERDGTFTVWSDHGRRKAYHAGPFDTRAEAQAWIDEQ